MVEKKITPKEFETYLRGFVGRGLIEFYYITDTLLVFSAGKKYQYDEVTTSKGKKKPLYHFEHELRISGDWKYEGDGQVVETSEVRSGEDAPRFRNRIEDFVESIHPKKVTSIKVSENGKQTEIVLDIGAKFIVTPFKDRYISLTSRTFGPNGNIVSTHHTRPSENTGELTHVEAP